MSTDPTEGMSDEQAAGVIDLLQARIDAMTTDDVLRFIQEHQGRIACHRCGETPPGDSEHWRVCEKHPARIEIAELEADNRRLRAGYAPAPAERPARDERVLVDRDILDWAAEMPCEMEADDEDDYDPATCSKYHSGRCWPCEARVILEGYAPAPAERPAGVPVERDEFGMPLNSLPDYQRALFVIGNMQREIDRLRAAAERPAPDPAHVACDKALDNALDMHDAALGEVERLKARIAAAERPEGQPVERDEFGMPLDSLPGYQRALAVIGNMQREIERLRAAAERPADALPDKGRPCHVCEPLDAPPSNDRSVVAAYRKVEELVGGVYEDSLAVALALLPGEPTPTRVDEVLDSARRMFAAHDDIDRVCDYIRDLLAISTTSVGDAPRSAEPKPQCESGCDTDAMLVPGVLYHDGQGIPCPDCGHMWMISCDSETEPHLLDTDDGAVPHGNAPRSEPAAGGDPAASTFERYPGLSRTDLAGALASISGMMCDCTGLLVPDDPRTYADQIRHFVNGLQDEIEALRRRPAASDMGVPPVTAGGQVMRAETRTLTMLAEAHRIAREEAQPYVAEALERIAAEFEAHASKTKSDAPNDEGPVSMTMHAAAGAMEGCASLLRAFARGERPLPGSEGR